MPSVLIEVRNEYSQTQEVALMEAVHSALREAFKIPEWDRNMRLVVHAPHRLACPPDREKPELYTHVSIDCFAAVPLTQNGICIKSLFAIWNHLAFPEIM